MSRDEVLNRILPESQFAQRLGVPNHKGSKRRMMTQVKTMAAQSVWRKRLQRLGALFLIWLVLVLVTFIPRVTGNFLLSSSSSTPRWTQSLNISMLSWTIWALITPLIVAVDRWLPVSRDALFKRFVLHVPLSVLFTSLRILVFYGAAPWLLSAYGPVRHISPFEALRASLAGNFQYQYQVYWIVVTIYLTFDYHEHLRKRELRAPELDRLVSEARLEALRAQLKPHFLFNALNTISSQVEHTPQAARRMLERLGELLRMSLAHSEDQEVPLKQELAFVEHYLEIQRARFEERLGTIVCDPDVTRALVPTFILQPLVENAILHGMSPDLTTSHLEVRAWRTNGHLHLSVQDNGSGLPDGWDPELSAGIGISNTRERLRHLYGHDQTFKISGEPGKGVFVDLSIPFHESAYSAAL
jgi:two-component system, LytTR family, sensor kinase